MLCINDPFSLDFSFLSSSIEFAFQRLIMMLSHCGIKSMLLLLLLLMVVVSVALDASCEFGWLALYVL